MGHPALVQQDLFEPESYLKNHRGNAYFALLSATPGSSYKRQKSYPVSVMPEVIRALHSSYNGLDSWISQAEFFAPTRRLVHVSRIGLLFADLDCYKVGIEGSPESTTNRLLRFCEKHVIPTPSIVVFSGRGLQVKWLLSTAIPQQAIPRWNALQQVLNDKLQAFGADTKALDASRVLRLVQTVNTKSNEIVRVVHHDPSAVHDFDKLVSKMYTNWSGIDPACDQHSLVIDGNGNVIFQLGNETRNSLPIREWVDHSQSKNTIGLRKFLGFQLAWDRLADLRKIAVMRTTKNGAVPDGQRDTFVFLAAVFLSQATQDQARIYDELKALSKEFVPHWTWEQVQNSASSALSRLKSHIKGEQIEFNGTVVSPRYAFRNETLISEKWLGISSVEETELQTIISTSEAKRRDAIRAKEKRLASGSVTRDQYLKNHELRRTSAILMRAQGKSWEDIAKALDYKNSESARKSAHQSQTTL